jgi:hypothetical protein
MTRLMLTIVILGVVASAITWVLVRKIGPVRRNVLAYAVGFLISSATSIAVFLALRVVLPASVLDGDGVIGSGLMCAVVGPTLGRLAARRMRPRLQGQR